jgi:Ca2+-binding RTX toxin-like protein
VSRLVSDETGNIAGSYCEGNVMTNHARNRWQQLAVAASGVTALGVAVVTPMQAAAADPARTASATVSNQTLVVNGTNGSDDIQIAVGDDPGVLLVDLGQHTPALAFDRATFSSISVFLGAGDDAFTVAARGGNVTEPLWVDGSNGNDTITGGLGTDTILGGSGDDTIDGGRGTDTEILGSGDDVAAWVPGEGNDIIDGGLGHDTLTFNGSNGNEKFDVSANGARALLTRDVGAIRMDIDGVERLGLATLGGVDQVTLHDLQQTDLRQAAIDLSLAGTGDSQPDTLVVDGSSGADHVDVSAHGSAVNVAGLAVRTLVTGAEGFDQLLVDTGDGNDSVHVDNAVAKLIGVTVDLGTGQTS